MDRNEEVGASMRTERPALSAPERSPSDRLRVLLSHQWGADDPLTVDEIVARALEALAEVLGADRGAIALVGSNEALAVAGSQTLRPEAKTVQTPRGSRLD